MGIFICNQKDTFQLYTVSNIDESHRLFILIRKLKARLTEPNPTFLHLANWAGRNESGVFAFDKYVKLSCCN